MPVHIATHVSTSATKPAIMSRNTTELTPSCSPCFTWKAALLMLSVSCRHGRMEARARALNPTHFTHVHSTHRQHTDKQPDSEVQGY
jgi:hypothetical protein